MRVSACSTFSSYARSAPPDASVTAARRPSRVHTGPEGFFVGQPPSVPPRTPRKVRHDAGTARPAHVGGPEPRPLAGGGRGRHRLRHPGRRDPPAVRPAVRLHARSGTSWSATSRAPGTRPRATRRRPAGSGSAWRPAGPGATNLVTPIADAYMDSVPDRRDHRPGAAAADRHRRVPGGRHPRHHDADHQAQLPGHRPGRDPAHDRRGVPHRRHRAPGSGAGRHRQGRAAGHDRPSAGRPARPAGLPPGDQAARQADPRGRPADRRVAPAGALRRRRRPQGAAPGPSCACSPS